MSKRMKKTRWRGVPTLHYQTRNMPVALLSRLTALSGLLGRHISKEMVMAVALEFGLGMIQRQYIEGALPPDEAKKHFMREFRELFGGWDEPEESDAEPE